MTITTDMPAGVTHGKVVGRFILAVGDTTGDPDNLPDAQPASGSVVFTALVPNFKTGFPEPAVVIRTPIRCSLNADGRLIDPAGSLGVWLVAGTYRVSYALAGATVDNHTIEVLPTHTSSAPLDLVSALPPGGPILTESQYAELSNRINAIDTTGVISSVNGQTGIVILDADDVGALTKEQADSLYTAIDSGGAGVITHTFSATGNLAVASGTHRVYNDTGESLTLTSVRASVGTAPIGAAVIVDVHLDGVTIFTTQTNRPTIAAETNSDLADAIEVSVWPSGSYLTVDVDQVGTSIPGANLTVTITAS